MTETIGRWLIQENDWQHQARWPGGNRRGGQFRGSGAPHPSTKVILERGVPSIDLMRQDREFLAHRRKIASDIVERLVGDHGIPQFKTNPDTGRPKMPRLDVTVGTGAQRAEAKVSVQAVWADIRESLPDHDVFMREGKAHLLSAEARMIAMRTALEATKEGRYAVLTDALRMPRNDLFGVMQRALQRTYPEHGGSHQVRLTFGVLRDKEKAAAKALCAEALRLPGVEIVVRNTRGETIFHRFYDRNGMERVRAVKGEWDQWP